MLNHRFKAGEYQIKPGQTGRQIADAIANGRVYQRLFTVVEGLTSREVVQQLEEAEGLTGELAIPPLWPSLSSSSVTNRLSFALPLRLNLKLNNPKIHNRCQP